MGSALATNLVERGWDVLAFDVAGSDGLPTGATFAGSVSDVACTTEVIVLSLPNGGASQAVAREVMNTDGRRVNCVVDTSTIGVDAAVNVDEILRGAGIAYVDAPVSGGVASARARTLAIMIAGDSDATDRIAPVLADLSDRHFSIGEHPGSAQALKLANNFLSATALVATSEAMAFGRSVGLDAMTMLEVLNASSGRNSATADKFPNQIVSGSYAAGFSNSHMGKDVRLYLDSVESRGGPATMGRLTTEVWEQFVAVRPEVDFTRIAQFIEGVDE